MGNHTAIIGGGLAGLTAAWQLHQLGQSFTLYEASGRLGGPIETVRRDGFTIDMGPDGWVTEKPWAAELARDLGLGEELIGSNDATRVTWIVRRGALMAMPEGMRMMVPADLQALTGSPLLSPAALAAYAAEPSRAEELRASSAVQDESVASFTRRHFGEEVLHTLAAPLLSGVFGGDVEKLSVCAVMPQFVQMERQHGSLIVALQQVSAARAGRPAQPIFTSLLGGTQRLIDRMAAGLPQASIRCNAAIQEITVEGGGWLLPEAGDTCEHLIVATPAHVTRDLLRNMAPALAEPMTGLLPAEASSAILVAFGFSEDFALPKGFGFLAPAGESEILAATFTDQKYHGRVPAGKRLLRAFFGGASESPHDARSDTELIAIALGELRRILGNSGYALPEPAFAVVRRWPRSLPQYAVGHPERVAELLSRMPPTLHLLGNAYRGVGLPDLIRDARATAWLIAG